jgi:tetratricopeptide (TPR) repeat protein
MSSKKMTAEMLEGAVLRLSRAIKLRRVFLAKQIVDEWIDQLDTLPLSHNAVRFTALCAWAIDLYGPYIERVEKAVLRFKQISLRELTLSDLASLNMAEGLVKYCREEYADAMALLEQVRADADRVGEAELGTVSRYYLGRTQFKLTNYEIALEYIGDAIRRELDAGNQVRAASMELDAAWLNFLLGEVKEAQARLTNARTILTGQPRAFIDEGNALSFQGRLYREDGQYEKALECYFEAIKTYGGYDPSYRNVARCRRNIAVIYRIMARDLSREKVLQDVRPQIAARVEELRGKAFTELKQALEIYRFDPKRYHHGLGIVHITLALLHFDAVELDQAAEEAQHAYDYGRAKGDNIVMAEARVIQAGIALEGYKGIVNAKRALRLANEAIQLGEQTERHRRLLARAYICKGHALLEPPYANPSSARQCYEEAKTYLVPEDKDYLRDSLDSLEAEINLKGHNSSLDIHLNEGDVRGRSLNEITERVEEQILRYIYECCGKSIPKAAAELKTGARKVRNAVSIFRLNEECLNKLEGEGVGGKVLERLACLKNRDVQGRASFEYLLKEKVGSEWIDLIKLIRKHVSKSVPH